MFDPKDIIEKTTQAVTLLKVLAPVAERLGSYIFSGGPEPTEIFEQLPELKSPAALEKAKYEARTRTGSNPPTNSA